MSPSRRTFLRVGAVATGVLAAGPLRALEALADAADRVPGDPGPDGPVDGGAVEAFGAAGNTGYGPLQGAGADLELPPGLRYVRFSAAGDRMSNGKPTPDDHDGMAAFPGPGNLSAEQEELRRLRAEVARLRAERDLLKKAAAYFASPPS